MTLLTELAHSLNTCPTLFFCLGTLLERSLPPEILLFGTRLHHLQKLLAEVNFSVNPLPSSPISTASAPRLMPGISMTFTPHMENECFSASKDMAFFLATRFLSPYSLAYPCRNHPCIRLKVCPSPPRSQLSGCGCTCRDHRTA